MDISLSTFTSACHAGDLKQIQNLVEGQNRLEDYLTRGLYIAAGTGQGAIVQYLLEQGARIDQIVPIKAADGNCLEVFQALLDHGWNVNDTAIGGQKILPLVVENEGLVRWFLDRGADPNCGPSHCPGSGAALNAAAAFGSVDVLNLLLDRGAKLELAQPLHSAASASRPDGDRFRMIDRLLELGLDINGFGVALGPHQEGTPIQHALMAGNTGTAQYLEAKVAIFREEL